MPFLNHSLAAVGARDMERSSIFAECGSDGAVTVDRFDEKSSELDDAALLIDIADHGSTVVDFNESERDTRSRRKASFAYHTRKAGRKKSRVVHFANALQHCRDSSKRRRIKYKLQVAVGEFIACGAEGATNPDFEVAVVQSIAKSAIGDLAAALCESLSAYRAAKTEEELAISHNNLSDDFLRLHQFQDAELHAREAIRLSPTHAGYMVQLVTVLACQEGRLHEAAVILNQLLEGCDDPHSVVQSHLHNEELLKERLPALADALDELL